jgi:hypothetical protein
MTSLKEYLDLEKRKNKLAYLIADEFCKYLKERNEAKVDATREELRDVSNAIRRMQEDAYKPETAKRIVRIEVSGGVAECTASPPDVEVEIIDHDNDV